MLQRSAHWLDTACCFATCCTTVSQHAPCCSTAQRVAPQQTMPRGAAHTVGWAAARGGTRGALEGVHEGVHEGYTRGTRGVHERAYGSVGRCSASRTRLISPSSNDPVHVCAANRAEPGPGADVGKGDPNADSEAAPPNPHARPAARVLRNSRGRPAPAARASDCRLDASSAPAQESTAETG